MAAKHKKHTKHLYGRTFLYRDKEGNYYSLPKGWLQCCFSASFLLRMDGSMTVDLQTSALYEMVQTKPGSMERGG